MGYCPDPHEVKTQTVPSTTENLFTLKRSKSVMLARLAFFAFFFAHEVASHFAIKSASCVNPSEKNANTYEIALEV